MRITKLSATNFGRHKKIDFTTSESVVGIIGPNGSGKSTLLDLLKFLFTGIVEDNLESYIRLGEKSAEGEALFIKDGQPGRIYRKITPTVSSRKLEWNGETATKETEVALKLAEILGADKHAVSNAVFIPQGDLDRLLFGDQAEREKLFTRLVNVAFLEKTVSILDTKIKQESASTEDLTAVVDELRVQLAQAGGHVQDIDLEYRAMPDQSEVLKYLRAVYDLSQQQNQANLLRSAASQAATQHQRSLQAALDSAGIKNWETIQVREQELVARRDAAQLRRDQLTRGRHVRDIMANTALEISQTEGLINGKRSEIASLDAGLSGINVATLQEQLRQLEQRAALQPLQDREMTLMASVFAEYTQHSSTQPPDKQVLEKIQQEGETLNQRIGALDVSLSALRAVMSKTCITDKCPVCAQHFNRDLISVAHLQNIQTEHDALAAQLRSKRAEYAQIDREIREHATKGQQLMSTYVQLGKTTAERAAQLAKLPTGDIAAARDQLQKVLTMVAQRQEVSKTLALAEKRLADLHASKPAADQQALAAAYTDADFLAANTEWSAVQAEQQRLLNLRNTVGSLWQSAARAEADAKAAEEDWNRKATAYHAHLARCPTTVKETDMADVPSAVVRLEGEERKRQECWGRLNQAREQLKTLQKRDLEVAERLHKNSIRMQVVDDLRRLRETFHRSGLPMAYVEYQFRRLTAMAQRNLSDLGANFTIDVNDARPVAFTFTRLDEAEGKPLDMMKLSGGQRVKLSISFLLAVQQLLIPEVGLLVLDEPSTHLDEESVESLKGLMMGMQQTLQNTSHQVWVVDHHTALQPAFGACLTLG